MINFSDLYQRKLPDDFVGREWMFQEIQDWLANQPKRKVMLIMGDPGVGKSAIAVQVSLQAWLTWFFPPIAAVSFVCR